jgi:hypothetical protein
MRKILTLLFGLLSLAAIRKLLSFNPKPEARSPQATPLSDRQYQSRTHNVITASSRETARLLAEQRGMSPAQFYEEGLKIALTNPRMTPHCLLPSDLEAFNKRGGLPTSVQEHIDACSNCQTLLALTARREGREDEFVERVKAASLLTNIETPV